MTYTIYQQGCAVISFRRKAAAIAKAEELAQKLDTPHLVQVVAIEKSGTYASRTQIWPTQSATYSN